MHRASSRAAAVRRSTCHCASSRQPGARRSDGHLGHVGNNDDLGTAWHAPSFAEDVELDFAKTAGKGNLLRGRNVLIAEEDRTHIGGRKTSPFGAELEVQIHLPPAAIRRTSNSFSASVNASMANLTGVAPLL